MDITTECLKCLQTENWTELNKLISSETNCKELNEDPTSKVFEQNLVTEIKRLDTNEEIGQAQLVLTRIFQLNTKNKLIKLSETCLKEIAEYLFQKSPTEEYAKLLPDDVRALEFLQNESSKRLGIINNTLIASSLNLKIGDKGQVEYSKKITNSPQEEELFKIACETLTDKFIYPNIALSLIIDDKILSKLNKAQQKLYYTSSIDLCIINRQTLMPECYFELDSSWHDKQKQIEKDIMKDEIFKLAGMTLIRIRKRVNKPMREIFKLVIQEHAS